jgi:hypothetical protein
MATRAGFSVARTGVREARDICNRNRRNDAREECQMGPFISNTLDTADEISQGGIELGRSWTRYGLNLGDKFSNRR